jgi:hypothetical protein
MICKKYDNLSHVDKIRYIGELIHIVQNDDEFYDMGFSLIYMARMKGILDGVQILPENNEEKTNNI